MPVHQILEMPAAELAGWYAHLRLSADEAKKARDKAKSKRRM